MELRVLAAGGHQRQRQLRRGVELCELVPAQGLRLQEPAPMPAPLLCGRPGVHAPVGGGHRRQRHRGQRPRPQEEGQGLPQAAGADGQEEEEADGAGLQQHWRDAPRSRADRRAEDHGARMHGGARKGVRVHEHDLAAVQARGPAGVVSKFCRQVLQELQGGRQAGGAGVQHLLWKPPEAAAGAHPGQNFGDRRVPDGGLGVM
mmetsp:Transcript_4982/g.17483  ORF Transcript_4982/g.17483 Transcript_4982/m.17483 type:complete len:203 (+) Transcript_4982:1726-2334(+)